MCLVRVPRRSHNPSWMSERDMVKKLFWCNRRNFGDTLTPVVFGHFAREPWERVRRNDTGKILGIGSILWALREGDVVLGSGAISPESVHVPKGARFVQVRGPLTRRLVGTEASIPERYGDPALLLPTIYRPGIEKMHECGYLPHYVDKTLVWDARRCECHERLRGKCHYCVRQLGEGGRFIDVQADWKTVVDGVLSCAKIVTSSLHGIICAEAYGIPVVWMRYSNKIVGGEFKFQDHFLGTGRHVQRIGEVLDPIKNLRAIQEHTIAAIQSVL
jgi:pyruvyltransferase